MRPQNSGILNRQRRAGYTRQVATGVEVGNHRGATDIDLGRTPGLIETAAEWRGSFDLSVDKEPHRERQTSLFLHGSAVQR
ncbi:MAG: hypothetical protein JWP30_436 [Homoserinimonas sp.]|jgi:hypothetical protein|nr:hypothetical protein [Homoserinimonas sp.]